MKDDEFAVVYATFPDPQSAQAVAKALVERKLAACVNIHAAMTSIYEWNGRLEAGSEVAVFIKTRKSLAAAAIAAARLLHPYTTPCFLILPISGGNDDYLAWLREQTRTG